LLAALAGYRVFVYPSRVSLFLTGFFGSSPFFNWTVGVFDFFWSGFSRACCP